jgi:hypothetical protein
VDQERPPAGQVAVFIDFENLVLGAGTRLPGQANPVPYAALTRLRALWRRPRGFAGGNLCFASDDMNWIPLRLELVPDQGTAKGLVARGWGIGDIPPADGLPPVVYCLPA